MAETTIASTADATSNANAADNEQLSANARYMIFGASLYWGAALMGYFQSGMDAASSALTSLPALGFLQFLVDPALALCYLILIVAMAVMLALSKKFTENRWQKALAWISLISSCVALLTLLPLGSFSSVLALIALVVRGIGEACFLLFWGLNFTALDKRKAERTTMISLGFAFLIYLVFSVFPLSEIATSIITNAMAIASVVPFLMGRYHIELVQRTEAEPNKKMLAPFFGSRVFYGICAGAGTFLVSTMTADTSYRASLLAIVVAIFIAYFVYGMLRKNRDDLTFLRLAPFTACFVIICPYLGAESLGESLCSCLPIVIWLCWMMLHSAQISSIKNDSGLDDVMLSFSEKLAFMVATILTPIVLGLVPQLSETLAANDSLKYSLSIAIVMLVLLVAAYQLNRVIDTKETERIVTNAFELSEQRNEPVYERIAQEYGLTPREGEVLRLLAKGMTRSAIREELCISEGTERTHIRHIYQKLDIHSHDELMALVDQEAREHVAK